MLFRACFALVAVATSIIACQSSAGGGGKTPDDVAAGDGSTDGDDGQDIGVGGAAGRGDAAPGVKDLKRLVAELNQSRAACLAAVDAESNAAGLGVSVETIEGCSATGVARGRAVLVNVVTECGGDSCSVLRWLLVPGEESARFIDQNGGGIAFFPSLEAYVFDAVPTANTEEEFYQSSSWPPALFKAEVGASPKVAAEEPKRVLFANCMSPTLAPNETYFYCRTLRGDVARVPMTGGKPGKGGGVEVVVENPTGKQPDFVSYAHVYPEAVRFEAANQFAFSVVLPDDGAKFFRVKLDDEGAVISVAEVVAAAGGE